MIQKFLEFPAVTYNFDYFVGLEVAYFIFLRQTIVIVRIRILSCKQFKIV